MKALLHSVLATWLAAVTLIGQAFGQSENHAPAPTVSVFWVGVFIALFIGLCVWFFVAMIRNDRKTKAAQNKAS